MTPVADHGAGRILVDCQILPHEAMEGGRLRNGRSKRPDVVLRADPIGAPAGTMLPLIEIEARWFRGAGF